MSRISGVKLRFAPPVTSPRPSFDQRLAGAMFCRLIAELRRLKLHSIIGGVALPNAASVALQEKFGLQKVAHFREIGWKKEQWIDVGYWELLL